MRLNLTKHQLGDFIIMLLFDLCFDDEFLKDHQAIRNIIERTSGLQSRTFNSFFKVDGHIRAKYKMFKNAFDIDNRKVYIELSPGLEESKDEIEIYKEIVSETVKQITGKQILNEKKLESLQEYII